MVAHTEMFLHVLHAAVHNSMRLTDWEEGYNMYAASESLEITISFLSACAVQVCVHYECSLIQTRASNASVPHDSQVMAVEESAQN